MKLDSNILTIVCCSVFDLWIIHKLTREPKQKIDYGRIEQLEKELELGPPYIQRPKQEKIERIW